MTTHSFPETADSETAQTVFWRCRVCWRGTNLSKPGYGEPHATMFEYPENIDAYLDPCPGESTGESRVLTRDQILGRISTEEIGALHASMDVRISGLMFKITNRALIDLDNPAWLADFQYAENLGLMDSGRAAIIVGV